MRRMTKALVALTIAVSTVGAFGMSAGATTIDGQFEMIGPVGPGSTTNLTVVGRGGVPATGVGRSRSTSPRPTRPPTATSPSGRPAQPNRWHRTSTSSPARPCPTWSSSPSAPTDRSRSTTTPATSTSSSTSSAGSPPATCFTGLTPARLMDTRPGTPPSTATSGPPDRSPGASRPTCTVAGRGGVPATGVGAVALNVTATNPTANGYLTVWPTGATATKRIEPQLRCRPNHPQHGHRPHRRQRTDLHLQRHRHRRRHRRRPRLVPHRHQPSPASPQPASWTPDPAPHHRRQLPQPPDRSGSQHDQPHRRRSRRRSRHRRRRGRPQRHRDQPDRQRLPHRLADRATATKRIEPQLRRRPDHAQHGHRPPRRRRTDLHLQRRPAPSTSSSTSSAGSPPAHASPASPQPDSSTHAYRPPTAAELTFSAGTHLVNASILLDDISL